MFSAARHGLEKNALSVFMTVAVVGLLLAAGPAGAIDIKINGLSGVHKPGKEIKFMFDVRINHGDTMGELLTNEKYAEVTIERLHPLLGEYEDPIPLCKVYANKTTDCEFLSVKDIKVKGNNNYGYGYGYGYDGETKHSLGYGYGYGYNNKNTHIIYSLSFDTTGFTEGIYTASVGVHAGSPVEHVFSSEESIFYLVSKGKSHDEEDKTKVEDHDVDAFDTAEAKIFIKTKKPVKGKVSVTNYETNPVWDLKGLSGLLHTKKYLDITADEEILGELDHAIIKIYYDKKDIKHIDEGSLAIYYWNEDTETWEYVGDHAGEDEDGKYIYVTVEHFSIYALFGSAPQVQQPPTSSIAGTASVQYPSVSTGGSSPDEDDVPEEETTTPEDTAEPAKAPKEEKPAVADNKPKKAAETPAPTGQVASAAAFPSTALALISSLMLFATLGYSKYMAGTQRTRVSFEKAFGNIFPAKKRVVKAPSKNMALENLSKTILGKNTASKISAKKRVAKAPSKKTVTRSSAKKKVIKASSKKVVAKKVSKKATRRK